MAIGRRMVVQSLVLAGMLCLLLFVPAGTLAWPQGWVFLAVFSLCSVAFGLWLRKADPDLMAERMKSPLGGGQSTRDRVTISALMAALALWLIFIALDARRFGWSTVPVWAQVAGAVLIMAAFYATLGVLRANSFAASQIRLQPERGQTVISTGPYAVVRHPMYAELMLLLIGTPLLLGSLWGLLGLVPLVLLLRLRILSEEAMLMAGLAGYREYAAKVRFRLLPGVW